MNLENLIEIMGMLGGELRPVSQWPLSVYNYQELERQAASLSEEKKEELTWEAGLVKYTHVKYTHIEQLDAFLDDVSWAGHLHELFFYQFDDKL